MSDIIETTKEAGIFFANPAEMAMRDQEKQGAKCCEYTAKQSRVVAFAFVFVDKVK